MLTLRHLVFVALGPAFALSWQAAAQEMTPHRAVYSVTTGLIAERWIPPSLQSRRGLTSN